MFARVQCWRKFAKCRFTHFPSFFSVHVDTYVIISNCVREQYEHNIQNITAFQHKNISYWLSGHLYVSDAFPLLLSKQCSH